MKISLIMATCGRICEPEFFVRQLLECGCPHKIEIIVVDQNDDDELERLLKKMCCNSDFELVYLRNAARNLSAARNAGLSRVSGDIVAFPDDDCLYFTDTLVNVVSVFQTLPEIDIVAGKLINNYDVGQSSGCNELLKLNRWNFFFYVNSCTLFIRSAVAVQAKFDERLGTGLLFGSEEDRDYIFSLLSKKHKAVHASQVLVFHPEKKHTYSSLKSYCTGFGGFCRKNLSLPCLSMLIIYSVYHVFRFFYAAVSGKSKLCKEHLISLKYRLYGFILWKKIN